MNEMPNESLLDRALRNLRVGWREIARATRVIPGPALDPDLPDADLASVREKMHACLDGRGGEVSARARAAALGEIYLGLSPKGRRRFLGVLARDFGIDRQAAAARARELAESREEDWRAAEESLRDALTPPRFRLLTQFNDLPEGVKFLVDLRADLLIFADEDPELRALERDLMNLLKGWFDVGFLDLERITWRSPALLLEKLIAYEAVHEISGWDDLKNRLDSDRRCFAFFHNRMPDEPLIFVEVALTDKIAGSIQDLLDTDAPVGDPAAARTAIFYSISNAQKGLAGISFGGFLIKQVVDALAAEFSNLKTFATLSPIPGFMRWLESEIAEQGAETVLGGAAAGALGDDAAAALRTGNWVEDETLVGLLEEPVMRAGARYLLKGKRRDGRARDPVANFHLTNGAQVETLNWLGDRSAKGLRQSAGLMVNYLYRLDKIEANHEAYRGKGEVAASSTVRTLAKE